MQIIGSYLRATLLAVGLILCASGAAQAEMPMPTNATPTLHGGQTMNGMAAFAEVGFPAMRAGMIIGNGGSFDFGGIISAPTYADADINGYFQQVGLDMRAPLRFRLLESSKLTGSLRVAPLFHVGRPGSFCSADGANCKPNVGAGTTVGFMMDIALPKIFKVIVGLDTRWGLWHNRDTNRFAGSTMVNAGLEALWKDQFFFQLIMHIGAQYMSKADGGEPVFRQLLGAGYKF